MNPKVIKYNVVHASEVVELEDGVQAFINNGYQPFGMIITTHTEGYEMLVQAMVMYE